MRKNFKSVARKSFALLMTAVTVMCGMPSVDTQAEEDAITSVDWTLYENGSSTSITNLVCDLTYIEHTRHYAKLDVIQSIDIEFYVNVKGYNVQLWDIAKAKYVSLYGLASTSTIPCFSVKYRDSSDTSKKSQFQIDGRHISGGYTTDGSIWYNE